MENGNFEELYAQTVKGEKETRELLLHFEQDYPGVAKEENIDKIAGALQRKASRASVLAQLRELKAEQEQSKHADAPNVRSEPER